VVVAVDIYGEGEFSRNEAPAAFAERPEQWAPYPFPLHELEDRIIAPSGLQLVEPLTVDRNAVQVLRRYALRVGAIRHDVTHVALQSRGSVFTSVALPLWKPPRPALQIDEKQQEEQNQRIGDTRRVHGELGSPGQIA
jgi:hypothetical protein